MAYSKEVVERFEQVLASPKQFSVGRFNPNDSDIATGMVGAPACGDVMKLHGRHKKGAERPLFLETECPGSISAAF